MCLWSLAMNTVLNLAVADKQMNLKFVDPNSTYLTTKLEES